MKTKQQPLFQRFSKGIFFLFLLFLPTQFGKHFFFDFSYLSGVRSDYLAPTLYLTDIFVIILFFANFKTVIGFLKNKKVFVFLTVIFIGLFFSKLPFISIYRLIKILEFLVVACCAKNFVKKDGSWKLIIWAIFLGAFFELGLSTLQFINKHSLQGIFYYFGERYLNLSLPGIAKASLNGIELLRPYGTFSHPNSLGGFYLLIYFFVLGNKKFDSFKILKALVLFLSSALVFLSFSKIIIIAFLILNTYFFIVKKKSYCKICSLAKITIFVAVGLIFITAKTDPLSFEKRLNFTINAWKIFVENPFFGAGLGTYLAAQNKFPLVYNYFFQQPVHNILLLFLSETGIVGTATLFWVLKEFVFKNLKKISFLLIFLAILITGFFDHYWLTLQQNFLLLAIVFTL